MSADFTAVQAPIKSLAVAVIFHVSFFYNTIAFEEMRSLLRWKHVSTDQHLSEELNACVCVFVFVYIL